MVARVAAVLGRRRALALSNLLIERGVFSADELNAQMASIMDEDAEAATRHFPGQRHEYMRPLLGLLLQYMRSTQSVRRGALSEDDVETARDAVVAEHVAHPEAGQMWQVLNERQHFRDRLDRLGRELGLGPSEETEEGT